MPVRNTTPCGVVKSSFEPLTTPCGAVLTADMHTGKCRDGLESHDSAPEYARARLFEFSAFIGLHRDNGFFGAQPCSSKDWIDL